MDRHRGVGVGGGGDRYGSNPDSPHHFRNSGGRSRSSFDAPMNHNQHRSPTNYREGELSSGGGFLGSGGRGGPGGGGLGGGGFVPRHRPFDSPPSNPSSGGGFRPTSTEHGGGDGFGSNYQVPLSGQKRVFPFSGRGGSSDHLDGGSFAKLFVGSVPRDCNRRTGSALV